VKPASVAYIATIAPVREVILAGSADLAYWRARLAEVGLFPHDDGGRAALSVSAIAGRFRGLPFREVSVAVVVSDRDGGPPDAIYLAGAFNSSRLLAWAERAFFRTPYQPANIRLNEPPAVAVEVGLGGHVAYAASMAAAGPARHEAQAWEGAIHLPPHGARRELFYARLAGPTTVTPFTAPDTLTIHPRGDDVLRQLVESGFAGQEWRVRTAAVHARSRTYRRAP